MDSFDHYGTTNLDAKYNSSTAGCSISAGNGRNATAALLLSSTGNLTKTLTANAAVLIVGMAIKFTAFPAGALNILNFYDSSTRQSLINLNTNGTLAILRGDSPIPLSTSTRSVQINAWHYLEFKITTGNAGSFEIRLDEEAILTLAGIDIQVSGNDYINNIRWVGQSSTYIDDLYACDALGAVNNDYLGDIRVEALLPTSDATYSQWTPTVPGTHWNLVDDNPASMTDNISDTVAGHIDTYGFSDLVTDSGDVLALQTLLYADKTDAGVRTVRDLVRVGGVDFTGDSKNVTTTPLYYIQVRENNPAGGVWLIAAVNAIEAGAELVL